MRVQYKNLGSGFSLIELMVVIAGLGILSSFAISNVIEYFDYASVDEAKSLLNSAAADCLQNLRRQGPDSLTQKEDTNIISQERLENTGYKFQSLEQRYLRQCSYNTTLKTKKIECPFELY